MVKTRIEESLGANPADAALNPADSVAMGVQSAGVPKDQRGRLFQALHRREYRLLFTAFLVNQVGFWISNISMQGLMADLSGNDPFSLGLLFFALFLPAFLLAPLAGVAADHLDRQRIMATSYVAVGLYSGVLAALTATQTISVPLLLLVSFLMGTAFSFAGPASMALVANAVKRDELPSAVSLQSAANNLTRVVGPALAAPLIAAHHFEVSFAIFLVLALTSAWLVVRMRPTPYVPETGETGIMARLRNGLEHARERRPTLPALVTVASMSLFGVSHVALIPIYAEKVLGDLDTFSWIVVVTGLGAMCGALATGYSRKSPNLRRSALRMLGYGATLTLFAQATSPLWALIAQFGVGYFYFSVMTSLQTLIQQRVDENRRGRVMSLFQVAWAGLIPFGGLAMGSLCAVFGVVATISAAGITCALYAVGLVALAGRLDPDDRANARNSGALRDPTGPPRAAATLPPAAASR
ncbi:MAG: MFS transporter [Myxococcales bacterium]|nr:MFS transporter [Myxococcales bacterium]